MKPDDVVVFNRKKLEQNLLAALRQRGPILLWSGDGRIPCNHLGLVPETLLDILKMIEQAEKKRSARSPMGAGTALYEGEHAPGTCPGSYGKQVNNNRKMKRLVV